MSLYNLAKMSTTTTGTGTITLAYAVPSFLTFALAGVQNGDTVTYAIEDGANREIGRGVYTSSGTTLTRSVLKSTNSNNPISLSGQAQVFITPAAEDLTAINNGTSYVLGQSAVAVVTPADTTEDTLATILVPANSMGINGQLRILAAFSLSSTDNARTLRIRLGGTSFFTGVIPQAGVLIESTLITICNRGVANSQVQALTALAGTGASATAIYTGAIDTTQDQNITITGQKAVAGDGLTLESYCVEIFPRN